MLSAVDAIVFDACKQIKLTIVLSLTTSMVQETIRACACPMAVEGKCGIGAVGEHPEEEIQGSN